MTTLKMTLAAVALAAIATSAHAATEPQEDVTAAINNNQTGDTTSLPSMQPAAGDTATPTTNTTAPSESTPPPTSTVPDNSSAVTNTTTDMTTASNAPADAIATQKMAMRRLTGDELSYTRNYIISSVGGLRDLSAVQDRLTKGMDDIASTMKTYYGDDTGSKLSSLLHDQVSDNIALINAVKSKNQKSIQDAQTRAQGNADDIASLISGANTNLSKDDISAALKQHIDQITAQAASRVKKDWKSDIDAFDRDEDQMMAFSDKVVDGIAKQYPDKFSSVPSSVAPASGP